MGHQEEAPGLTLCPCALAAGGDPPWPRSRGVEAEVASGWSWRDAEGGGWVWLPPGRGGLEEPFQAQASAPAWGPWASGQRLVKPRGAGGCTERSGGSSGRWAWQAANILTLLLGPGHRAAGSEPQLLRTRAPWEPRLRALGLVRVGELGAPRSPVVPPRARATSALAPRLPTDGHEPSGPLLPSGRAPCWPGSEGRASAVPAAAMGAQALSLTRWRPLRGPSGPPEDESRARAL